MNLVRGGADPVPDALLALAGLGLIGGGVLLIALAPLSAAAFAGTVMCAVGLLPLRALWNRSRERRARASAPGWLADHPWPGKRFGDLRHADLVSSTIYTLAAAIPIAAFGAILVELAPGDRRWWLLAPGLAALGGLIALKTARRLAGLRRWGLLQLELGTVPAHPGDELAGVLRTRGGTADVRRLRAALRAIEVRYERAGKAIAARGYTVATLPVSLSAPVQGQDGSSQVLLSAVIPAGAPSTRLAARPPTFWQLEIYAVDDPLDAVFLIPVYEKNP